jgi:hypothetical protein
LTMVTSLLEAADPPPYLPCWIASSSLYAVWTTRLPFEGLVQRQQS